LPGAILNGSALVKAPGEDPGRMVATQVITGRRDPAVRDAAVHRVRGRRRASLDRPAADQAIMERVRRLIPAPVLAIRNVIAVLAETVLEERASIVQALLLGAPVFQTLMQNLLATAMTNLLTTRRLSTFIS